MAEYQKFMFDNFILRDNDEISSDILVPEAATAVVVPEDADNTDNTEINSPNNITPIISGYTDDEVAEKIKIAEAMSYQKGQDDANGGLEAENSRLLENIDKALEQAVRDYSAIKEGLDQQFKNMAAALITHLIPSLLEEHSLELVNSFLENNFKNFAKEAKLSFYFNPEAIAKAQETVSRLAHINDFEGKITLHKDLSLSLSDCRVEWDNGGVERNTASELAKASELIVQ